MTFNPFHSRQTILLAIIMFYLLPILSICIYSTTFISFNKAWNLLGLGFFLTFAGSLILFWIMYAWEQSVRVTTGENKVHSKQLDQPIPISNEQDPESPIKQQMNQLQNEHDQLQHEFQTKIEELQILQRDKDLSQEHYEQIYQEYHNFKNASQEQLEQHKNFIHELQEKIDQQRNAIEKKQQQISQLETKVGDLTYEIKILLHLAESTHPTTSSSPETLKSSRTEISMKNEAYAYTTESDEEENFHPPHIQIHSCDEAMTQLKRCLDIAQKMTGSTHFSNENSRLRDLTVDNFALDLRRLCDRLRSENHSAIVLYSPNEDKLIFANNKVKTLLGWTPEKLVQNFADLIQEGENEWKNHLAHISLKNESQIRLLMKTKKGHDLLVHCHLGIIPTGVFRYHVIGVLHPA